MNVHDSERIADVLRPHGYALVDKPEQADIVLVNTCSVREKSYLKVRSVLGQYTQLKEKRPQLLLGVAGCIAQQEGNRLFELVPELDLVFSPDHISLLPELIEKACKKHIAQTGFIDAENYSFLRAAERMPSETAGPTALVTIQKGCDNHCSYCIVPLVRGPEVSRPAEQIISEVQKLVDSGVKEVTLIGQNVNSYHGFFSGLEGEFVRLLDALDEISGLKRLRFTTSHPKDFSLELAKRFGTLRTLCPWLHLPVQSGSTNVLRLMNRGYSREHYLQLIQEVKRHCPDISIGTDIIVGYPGETEADYRDTVRLLEEVQYDYIYSFKYSVRPNTPAAQQLKDDVSESEKSARLQELQSVQAKITKNRLKRLSGRTLQVLVEGPSRKGPPQFCGRAPGNQVVNFECHKEIAVVGKIVNVIIESAGNHSLSGSVVESS